LPRWCFVQAPEGGAQDGGVEPDLAPEVVADEGLVGLGPLGDGLHRDGVEAVLGEQLRARGQQGLAGGFGVVRAAGPAGRGSRGQKLINQTI
jgi:hypothetical protein